MKKIFCVFLAALLILSLAACGGGSGSGSGDFTWTRVGTFMDEENNFLSISESQDPNTPGWLVGIMIGEDMYGDYIQQEGDTLHGDLAPDGVSVDPYVVTISEEGEDGVLLEVEGGESYHFTPYEIPTAAITVYVNIEGFGQVNYADEGEEPEFDDEYPMQSIYLGLEGPETHVLAAKADEGWHFIKWLKDGEEFSRENPVTVEMTESAEYIAVFYKEGKDDTPVDLDAVKTIGDLLTVPDLETCAYSDVFLYVFQQDGKYYRAVAPIDDATFNEIMDLEFDDPDYDAKYEAIIGPLEVTLVENLDQYALSQEQLDALVGKLGADLLDAGWYATSYDLSTMEFNMNYEYFTYTITFTGDIADPENFEDEDIRSLTVSSAEYYGLGNGGYYLYD